MSLKPHRAVEPLVLNSVVLHVGLTPFELGYAPCERYESAVMTSRMQWKLPSRICMLAFLSLVCWANTPNSIELGLFTPKRTSIIEIEPIHDQRYFVASQPHPKIEIERIGLPLTYMRRDSIPPGKIVWEINSAALLQNVMFALAVQCSLGYLSRKAARPSIRHFFLLTLAIAILSAIAARLQHLPQGIASYYLVTAVLVTPVVVATIALISDLYWQRHNNGSHQRRQ